MVHHVRQSLSTLSSSFDALRLNVSQSAMPERTPMSSVNARLTGGLSDISPTHEMITNLTTRTSSRDRLCSHNQSKTLGLLSSCTLNELWAG